MFGIIDTNSFSGCVDKYPKSCKENRELCKDGNRFSQSMADMCPLTCNTCTQSSPAPSKDPLLAALSTNPYTDPPVTSKKSPLSFNIFQPATASGSSNSKIQITIIRRPPIADMTKVPQGLFGRTADISVIFYAQDELRE